MLADTTTPPTRALLLLAASDALLLPKRQSQTKTLAPSNRGSFRSSSQTPLSASSDSLATMPDEEPAARPKRSPLAVPTALFYAITSVGIISANKVTLTQYAFPSASVLAFLQFGVTVACLGVLKILGVIDLAPLDVKSVRVVLPLTALFLADVLMGLFATGNLSLPMFTVLRRFSIPTTMLLERFVGQSNPTLLVQAAVWGMVGGAVIAAYDDLGFDIRGYTAVGLNDLFTACRGVYLKHALGPASSTSHTKKDVESGEEAPKPLSKLSLLFYNALLSGIALYPYLRWTGDLEVARQWFDAPAEGAVVAVALSASLGPVLQYAIFVCTQHNSALTTTVVGALKNVATTYVGMFLGGDYAYSLVNFAGITVSCVASLVYSWAVLLGRQK